MSAGKRSEQVTPALPPLIVPSSIPAGKKLPLPKAPMEMPGTSGRGIRGRGGMPVKWSKIIAFTEVTGI